MNGRDILRVACKELQGKSEHVIFLNLHAICKYLHTSFFIPNFFSLVSHIYCLLLKVEEEFKAFCEF